MEARIGRLRLGYLRPEVQSRLSRAAASSRRRAVAPSCRPPPLGEGPVRCRTTQRVSSRGRAARARSTRSRTGNRRAHTTQQPRDQSSEATMIEPKPIALTPWTSEAVVVVTVVDCASVRRISEARVEGEWRKRGLELPSGRP